jgi:hypothetical protein
MAMVPESEFRKPTLMVLPVVTTQEAVAAVAELAAVTDRPSAITEAKATAILVFEYFESDFFIDVPFAWGGKTPPLGEAENWPLCADSPLSHPPNCDSALPVTRTSRWSQPLVTISLQKGFDEKNFEALNCWPMVYRSFAACSQTSGTPTARAMAIDAAVTIKL